MQIAVHSDHIDRKSFSGYAFILGGSIISWFSKKQSTTELFTTEAEYLSNAFASKHVLWIKNLLSPTNNRAILRSKMADRRCRVQFPFTLADLTVRSFSFISPNPDPFFREDISPIVPIEDSNSSIKQTKRFIARF